MLPGAVTALSLWIRPPRRMVQWISCPVDFVNAHLNRALIDQDSRTRFDVVVKACRPYGAAFAEWCTDSFAGEDEFVACGDRDIPNLPFSNDRSMSSSTVPMRYFGPGRSASIPIETPICFAASPNRR